jgi:hypothetical protein
LTCSTWEKHGENHWLLASSLLVYISHFPDWVFGLLTRDAWPMLREWHAVSLFGLRPKAEIESWVQMAEHLRKPIAKYFKTRRGK